MSYDLTYGACRDIGHTWHFTFWGRDERTLVCSGCGTCKTQTFTGSAMRVKKVRYRYPKGYQVKGGVSRSALSEIRHRLASHRRIRWLRPRKK